MLNDPEDFELGEADSLCVLSSLRSCALSLLIPFPHIFICFTGTLCSILALRALSGNKQPGQHILQGFDRLADW